MTDAGNKEAMRKYKSTYRAIYEFHERYVLADSDADFEQLVAELPGLSRASPFMANLLNVTTAEINREYEWRRSMNEMPPNFTPDRRREE